MDTIIRIYIPGEPVAQGRPRFARLPHGGVVAFDPKKSRNWKATAQTHIRQQWTGPPMQGPLVLSVLAVFSCPVSQYRKRDPHPRRPHAKRPDAENVLKAFQDAAEGVLWLDDSQVTSARITKAIGAQGEAPHLVAELRAIRADEFTEFAELGMTWRFAALQQALR